MAPETDPQTVPAKPVGWNKYDDAIVGATDAVRGTLASVQNIAPDDHATALKVAAQTGVTTDAAAAAVRAKPAAETQSIAGGYQALIEGSTHLKRWLVNRDNAAIGQDDIPSLAEIEQHVGRVGRDNSFADDLVSANDKGKAKLNGDAYLLQGAFATRHPAEAAHAYVMERRAGAKVPVPGYVREAQGPTAEASATNSAAFEALAAARNPDEFLTAASDWMTAGVLQVGTFFAHPKARVYSGAEGLAPTLPALVGASAGALTLNPAGAALGFGLGSVPGATAGWVEKALAEKGVNLDDEADLTRALSDPALMGPIRRQAAAMGLSSGLMASLTMLGVGGFAGEAAAAGTSKIVGAAKDIVGLTMAQAAGTATQNVATGQPANVGEAAQGALEGLPFIGAMEGLKMAGQARHLTPEAILRSVMVTEDGRSLVKAVDAATESKAATRAPDPVRGLIQAAAGRGEAATVRVGLEEWNAVYAASGRSPLEAAEEASPQGAKLYHEAQQTGEIALPTQDVVMLGKRNRADFDALLPAMRVRVDGPTLAEAQASLAALPDQMAADAERTTLYQSGKARLQEQAAALDAEIAAAPVPDVQALTAKAEQGVATPADVEALAAAPEQQAALDKLTTRRAKVQAKLDALAASEPGREEAGATLREKLNESYAVGLPKYQARGLAELHASLVETLAELAGVPVEDAAARAGLPTRKATQAELGVDETGTPNRAAIQVSRAAGVRVVEAIFGPKADPSSGLHEFGHHAFDVLRDFATEPDALPAVRALYEDAMRELGGDPAAGPTDAQHERFADGFLGHLLRGEAPSPALRRAFAVIQGWLLKLVRKAQAVGIVPSEGMRAVFDRMLATDDQIAAARAEQGTNPLFADKPANVSPEEHAAYLADMNAAFEEARTTLNRKRLAEVTAEQRALREEKLADLRVEVAAKFDASEAIAKLGDAEQQARLREGLKADPEATREIAGFDSVDALTDALKALDNREKIINAAAWARLKAEFPEMRPVKEQREDARAATQNDKLIAGLRDELSTLNELIRAEAKGRKVAFEAIPTEAYLRETARAFLSSKPIREIRPNADLAIAARESNAAAKAYAAGKNEEAATHKAAEIRARMRYAEGRKIIEASGVDSRSVDRLQTDGRQASVGKAGGEWKGQMNRLGARFGLGKIRPDESAALSSLESWVAALDARAKSDGDVFVPVVADWLLKPDAKPTHWRDLTPEQLHELRIAAESIYKIASNHDKAAAAAHAELISDRVAAIVARVASLPDIERGFQQPPNFGQRAMAEQTPIDRYVYELDGGPGGPLAKAILFPRNEGEAEVEGRRRDLNLKLAPIWKELPAGERALLGMRRSVEGVGRSLTHEQRHMIALYEGNAEGKAVNRNAFTEAEIAAVMRTLTKADAAWANGMWAAQEAYWPEMSALFERAYGAVPPKVVAVPMTITNAAGETLELTGGYSKNKYAGRRAHEQSLAEVAGDLQRGAFMASTVKMGARFERQQNVKLIPRYDYGVIYEGLGEAITGLSLVERLHDINAVLRNDAVRKAIEDKKGPEAYEQFREAINALAGGNLKRQSAGERTSLWFRRGTIISKLGFKVMTQVVNASGIMNSIDSLGPEVAKEAALLMADPRAFAKAVREMHVEAPEMAVRSTSMNRDMMDMRGQLKRRFSADPLRAAAMLPMSAVQLGVDLPSYRVAKRQAIGRGESPANAIRIASQAVKDAQGSGFPADLPAVMRDHQNMTMFLGFLNRSLNLAARRVNATEWRNPAKVIRLAASIGAIFAAPAMIQLGANALRGDTDDDPFWLSTLKETLSNVLGGVPYVRDLAAGVKYGRWSGPAQFSVIGDAAELTRELKDGDISEGDWLDILSLTGWVAQLPTPAAVEAWKGTEAVMDGDAPPFAVIAGKPRHH